MGRLPDLIFVIDTVREQIAIKEAQKLNIPIAAIIDTNSNPEGITYPIPGNDDSAKSIKLYCELISQAALDGISVQTKQFKKELTNDEEKLEVDNNAKNNKKSKDTDNESKDKKLSKESKTKEIEKEGQSEEVKAAIDLSKEEKKD